MAKIHGSRNINAKYGDRPLIPVLSTSEIQETAKSHHGDTEKVATTPVSAVSWRDVDLSSRYDKAHEYETMLDMVEALGKNVEFVSSIFCDSKATETYSVRLKSGTATDARRIGDLLDSTLLNGRVGGHNGIYITGNGIDETVDPNWIEFHSREIHEVQPVLCVGQLVQLACMLDGTSQFLSSMSAEQFAAELRELREINSKQPETLSGRILVELYEREEKQRFPEGPF